MSSVWIHIVDRRSDRIGNRSKISVKTSCEARSVDVNMRFSSELVRLSDFRRCLMLCFIVNTTLFNVVRFSDHHFLHL